MVCFFKIHLEKENIRPTCIGALIGVLIRSLCSRHSWPHEPL